MAVSYPCPSDARWQFAEGPPGPGQAVQHGDLGPWNLLWGSDGQVAGVLDWELAGPASPLYDTGHLAWFTVPLMDDARARAHGFPQPPDRLARVDAFARGARLPVSEVLGAALQAQQEYARRIVTTPEEPWATFRRLGFHENATADGEWTRAGKTLAGWLFPDMDSTLITTYSDKKGIVTRLGRRAMASTRSSDRKSREYPDKLLRPGNAMLEHVLLRSQVRAGPRAEAGPGPVPA